MFQIDVNFFLNSCELLLNVLKIDIFNMINKLLNVIEKFSFISNIEYRKSKLIASSRDFDSMSNRREKMKSKIVSN